MSVGFTWIKYLNGPHHVKGCTLFGTPNYVLLVKLLKLTLFKFGSFNDRLTTSSSSKHFQEYQMSLQQFFSSLWSYFTLSHRVHKRLHTPISFSTRWRRWLHEKFQSNALKQRCIWTMYHQVFESTLYELVIESNSPISLFFTCPYFSNTY